MSNFPNILFSAFRTAMVAGCMVAVISLAAIAGPFEDGDAAYQRGDYAAAMAILRPLAEQGNAGAQNDLGLMYLNGRGATKNQAEAVSWLRLSADQGNAEAQARLGAVYFNGWGVPPDLAESAKWYRDAADQGYAEAQYELGALYENGFGVAQDYVEAMKWSILAVSGYPDSEVESRRLATVNRDRQAEKLAPAEIAEAENRAREWKPTPFRPLSADLFKDAMMVVQRDDYAMAARLLRPQAEEGGADAQVMLGQMYNIGKGVPRSHKEAVKWFRLAAQQGDAGGQDGLGLAYEEGAGIPRDYVHAYMWYGLAAASGDPYVDSFAQDRDKIASKMTGAQIAEARAMAEKCKISNFKGCD